MKQLEKYGYSTRLAAVAVIGLAIATLPFSTAVQAATDTATSTVTATVGETISVAVSGNVAINVTPTAGGMTATGSHDVTVNTNNAAGFTLRLASNTATSNLANGANVLAPAAGTHASPAALAANTWGYRLASFTANMYTGMPATASPNTLKTTAVPATNDVTAVTYGVNVTTARPSGTYTNSVIYTAVTN